MRDDRIDLFRELGRALFYGALAPDNVTLLFADPETGFRCEPADPACEADADTLAHILAAAFAFEGVGLATCGRSPDPRSEEAQRLFALYLRGHSQASELVGYIEHTARTANRIIEAHGLPEPPADLLPGTAWLITAGVIDHYLVSGHFVPQRTQGAGEYLTPARLH